MKKSRSLPFCQLLAATVLLVVGASSVAATNWSFNTNTNCTSTDYQTVSAGSCSGTSVSSSGIVSIAGWSTGTGSTSAPGSGNNFASAAIYDWATAGYGVVAKNENSGDQGPHAADNHFGTDAFLLQFTNQVALTNVGIGWSGSSNKVLLLPGDPGYSATSPRALTSTNQDSDFSVLAYIGGGSNPSIPTISGADVTTLLSSGWQLVGNYANLATGGTAAIGTAVSSSYWLISAYNTSFGKTSQFGTDSATCGTTVSGNMQPACNLDAGNDYFKLLSIAGTRPLGASVPEPGSLALMGAALAGLVTVRQRRRRVA